MRTVLSGATLLSALVATLTADVVHAQIRLPVHVAGPTAGGGEGQTVLAPADIEYVGAIRMPASGVDTFSSYGAIGGRIVDGNTHLFVYTSPVANQWGVAEISVAGLTPNPSDYTAAPRATLVMDYGDIFHDKRVSYRSGVEYDQSAYLLRGLPDSLIWRPESNCLYWSFHDNYNTTANLDYTLGCSTLNSTTGSSTAYGPWLIAGTDGDGRDITGLRHNVMSVGPDGELLFSGKAHSGNHSLSQGPSLYRAASWPTTSTPGGLSATPIASTRMLDYPSMADSLYSGSALHHYNVDGTVHGYDTAFKYPSGWGYQFEDMSAYGNPFYPYFNLYGKPGLSGAGWGDEQSSIFGSLWFRGANKQGVIFAATVAASTDSSGHFWYRSEGQGRLLCVHGLECTECATGPSNRGGKSTVFIIYDQAKPLAVAASTAVDYQQTADHMIDLTATYGIRTAPEGRPHSREMECGFFDAANKLLYCNSNGADNSRVPGNPNVTETLVHVWRIND